MTDSQSEGTPVETFVPRGAVAFFIVMGIFYAAFWLAMYLLMAQRG